MSLKKQVTTGVKWTTVATTVLAVVAVLKISVLARFLEKSDFGLMALVTFVMGFMNLFNDMGLTSAILHKQEVTKSQYASLYWFNLCFSGVIYLLLLGVTPLVASFYKEQELTLLIPLVGLNLLISGIGNMFKTMEQKNLLFKQIALIDIGCAAVSLLLAIYLAVNNYGVYALVYPLILQVLLNNLLYLGLGVKKYGLQLHFKLSETKPFLKIGIYQVGGQVVNYFNRDLDVLIIGKLFSTDVLGGYSLAKQLVSRPMQVLNPIISKVASPTLARFQNDIVALKSNYLKLINIIATINVPAYLLVIIFAPWIVQILYGVGYENIVILVRILSVYMLVRAVSSPVGSLVIATGRTDLEFYWNLLTLLITPICVYIGSQFGIVGAALGMTLAMLLLFVPCWKVLIFKLTHATFAEYSKAIFFIRFSWLKKGRL
jgi:O-antigen/teichoic acid export membrane protein